MIFSKTATGYLHLKSGKPCQDFSISYHDGERSILAVCDGHGGELYIRSHIGSKLAAKAALQVLLECSKEQFYGQKLVRACENVKLKILCAWNHLVEEHLKEFPLRKGEIEHLDEGKRVQLKRNPIKAYGTTLCALLVLGGRAICARIGDSEAFVIGHKQIASIFKEDEEEPVGNYTHSLCDEDAFSHICVEALETRYVKGVLLCTDGVINPYQNLENFARSFALPTVERLRAGKQQEVADFIEKLGGEIGIGDDVSLAVYYK